MSKLRPECGTAKDPSRTIYGHVAYLRIFNALSRRRGLIFGKLDGPAGEHCALGQFWEDAPGTPLPVDIVDEIAAVNDSVKPGVSKFKRWQRVREYLRIRLATCGVEV